jgi:3D (Asp-Asp-Asp) domain-containing protein
LTVELIRAKPLTVHLADESVTIRTTAGTVGVALAGAGLALQGLDYSKPSENEPLPENDQIQVIRVEEEILLKQEQIPFSSEYQAANDLELDQLQILSGGEFGLSAQRLRITYENGTEISRELEKEWIIKEPEPRIVGYGTQINIQTADTPDGQITYWRKITAWATSYNPSCPGCDNWTSSGTVLRKGTIAVTLDWYRYMKFAKVYIPGYGFGRIEDVGGGVPWSVNWVDLGYKKDEYVPWSENVTVYFLAPAPPPECIMYILY